MELKEIVNLRKLSEEFYYDDSKSCSECPFRDICGSSILNVKSQTCIAAKIVGHKCKDMYDLEREQISKVS